LRGDGVWGKGERSLMREGPKTFGWKARAIETGDRKRWYELPEEVDGGP
jgi:hypothetical protein